ncbi:mycofactocin biosynthesis peptidyl-dipeptidase MftE [Microbacterium murale]|uniref:Mycofactocin system creatinine amidohydrolase family protein MftE n=1 Tax=Microbacterium murale TaxID=1081040 RepID=A0ABQ1RKK5_9MICO|nr:mycofactocin biosynthesis peptidyl-dipeptidase MftE [Microbacterium murale]GGD70079.1 putative mycofactocin system creatinine amidohydrolase family protein MftE [Microbacterium murale]
MKDSTRRLDTLAWPDIPAAPTVIIPLGSTEQHGHHLPFDTDTVIATAVSDRLSMQAIVLPAVAYSSSGEHQGFPGTVSIGQAALRGILIEMVRSLACWAGRIVVVNGHGGNVSCLSLVIPELIAEGHDVSWLPCVTPSGDAHAGFTETSIMLHLAPDRVHLDRAASGPTTELRLLLPRLTRFGVRAVSLSGVLGDPQGANADAGRRLLCEMVDAAVRRIEMGQLDHRGCLTEAA